LIKNQSIEIFERRVDATYRPAAQLLPCKGLDSVRNMCGNQSGKWLPEPNPTPSTSEGRYLFDHQIDSNDEGQVFTAGGDEESVDLTHRELHKVIIEE
jgi:hypothetical protein